MDQRKSNDSKKSSIEDAEFYWDWIKHEDNQFSNRGSFFLVGEAMLLSAYATILSQKASFLYGAYVLSFAGIFITLIWLYVNFRHIYKTQRAIKNQLHQIENRWSSIAKQRSRWPANHFIMGLILPVVILLTWIALSPYIRKYVF
jgi:hypothetical protein